MAKKVIWLLKVLVAFSLALSTWELILSQTYIKKPLSKNHPVLGRIEGEGTYIQGKEGYSRTHLNELGRRSLPLAPKKKGEKRILVLGDSYTAAMQVSDQVTYVKQLENRLTKLDKITVINSGADGESPSSYIALASFYQKIYQPDLVIIQLNEWDFINNPFNPDNQFFFKQTSQGYQIARNKDFVSKNSLVSQFANWQSKFNFSVVRVAIERLNSSAGQTANETPKIANPPYLSTLVPFTVQNLRAKYGQPILVFIPRIDYFANNMDRPSLTESLLERSAKEQGLKLVSMRRDYVQKYRQSHQTSHGFNNTEPGIGHINALGHKLLADRLYQTINADYMKATRL